MMRARDSDLVLLTLANGIGFYVPRSTVGDVRRTRAGASVNIGGKVVAVTESYAELSDSSAQPNRYGLSGKKGSFDAGTFGG